MDYKRGKSSSAYKIQPRLFTSRRVSCSSQTALALVLSVEFLEGMEVARTLSLVCRLWNKSVSLGRVWETFAYAIAPSRVVNRLRKFWKCAFTSKVRGQEELNSAALDKYIFAYLVRKMCSECWAEHKPIRICALLGRALCADCQKLPQFTMITAEQALVDFRLTEDAIAERGVRGLTVPGKHRDGHSLTLYYLSDIARVKEERGESGCRVSRGYSGAKQARESELLRHLTELGVLHRKFLKLCFETEGNPAYNFVRGRSQQGARKIALKLAGMFKPWLEKTQCFIDLEGGE